jgi:small-conductance mechanosensitive channel
MPLLDLFWAMLWFFLWVAWIWLIIVVLTDLFRSEMSGAGKALWTLFVVFLPFLGILIYMIARGGGMQERAERHAVAQQQRQEEYIRSVTSASSASTADEISKLAALHDRGVITDTEFNAKKAALLG